MTKTGCIAASAALCLPFAFFFTHFLLLSRRPLTGADSIIDCSICYLDMQTIAAIAMASAFATMMHGLFLLHRRADSFKAKRLLILSPSLFTILAFLMAQGMGIIMYRQQGGGSIITLIFSSMTIAAGALILSACYSLAVWVIGIAVTLATKKDSRP